MKEHIMNLKPSPLGMIRKGKKTIELRLYDEKRKYCALQLSNRKLYNCRPL